MSRNLSGEEVRVSVDNGVLHSLINTIVQVNIGVRVWHIRHLSKDVPVNLELPELLRGHLKIEVGGWLPVLECKLLGW